MRAAILGCCRHQKPINFDIKIPNRPPVRHKHQVGVELVMLKISQILQDNNFIHCIVIWSLISTGLG